MVKRKREQRPTATFAVPSSTVFASAHQASVQRIHPNGRHLIRNNFTFAANLPPRDPAIGASPLPPSSLAADDDREADPDPFDDDATAPPVRREYATLEHDSVLREWSQQTGKFVDELLRLDGPRGFSTTRCPTCPPTLVQVPRFRCDDCMGGIIVCSDCCVGHHQDLPFHRIKEWTGQYFKPAALQDLGLVVQLGHPIGERCIAPSPAPAGGLVLHTNGFHPITLQYCECHLSQRAGDRVEQLLRMELYPATLYEPTTFCTFRMLESFHILTLQSKINASDYYESLVRLTDNLGIGPSYDRLKPFLRCVREWRHLKMLKRAGRGYIVDGTRNVKPGELAVPCLACPKAGFNIPDNWHTAPEDTKFIYSLMIAIDANFRLKRRAISNNARDPALGSGWAYFVEDEPYRNHVLNYADQEDISTCTGFAALYHANTKHSAGYATTGVAMCICARHGVISPNGVGDLQKGERYCNIDYIVACAVALLWPLALLPLLLSYDIICQWIKNLQERFEDTLFPASLQDKVPTGDVRYVIPKYHFNGHKEADHNKYSLNFKRGVGRTDGEEVERNWFRHNSTAASTREMGPGSRHDTLDDHFGWNNFLKMIKLGAFLHRKLQLTLREHAKHEELYRQFTASLKPESVKKWLKEAVEWEKDSTKPDPYFVAPSGLTEAQIRAELTEEDKEKGPSLHKLTPSAMLVELLEIEDQQRRFILRFPKVNTIRNPSLVVEIVEKRMSLQRRIRAVREAQAIYMPPVPQLVARHILTQAQADASTTAPASNAARIARLRNTFTAVPAEPARGVESDPLFFPHQLSIAELDLCHDGIADMEARLRLGQMRSSLDKVRIQLHIKSRLIVWKRDNVRCQVPNTRAVGQIDSNEGKLLGHAEKYRAARVAYFELVGGGDWQMTWRELRHADVRCLKDTFDEEPGEGEPEGHREVSWIWQSADRTHGGAAARVIPGLTDALRGEFLRSRARWMRWHEEVLLLQEEQRRTIMSLEKYAEEWDARATGSERIVDCPLLQQGLQAYAHEQAAGRRSLAQKFLRLWKGKPKRGVTSLPGSRSNPVSTVPQGNNSTRAPPANAAATSTGPSIRANTPLLFTEVAVQQEVAHGQGTTSQAPTARANSTEAPTTDAQSIPTAHALAISQDERTFPIDTSSDHEGDVVEQDDEDIGREQETDEHGLGLQRMVVVAEDSDEE